MRHSHKILIASLFVAVMIFSYIKTHAAEPEAFVVEVQPSSFDPNTPVDMTIKAVKGDGTVIKEYEGDAYIDVIWSIDPSEYVVPSDHLYTFAPQDQWVKLFSKWLIIKKEWTYTIQVSDIANDSIKGEKTVIVGSQASTNAKPVTIDSPTQSGTEKNEIVSVFGSSLDLPNSPYEIRLNNVSATQWITDAIGSINTFVTWVVVWTNTLQVKILDVNNTIIGESDVISFTYAPIADGVFNSIQVLPSTKMKQGTKATFIVDTNDAVSSAELQLSNGTPVVPMEKSSPWVFKKELMMDTAGNIGLIVHLMLNGQKKSYSGIADLIIEKWTAIGKVRLFSDPVTKNKLNITREVIGEASKYKVFYGTWESNLVQSVTVNINEMLLENLLTWTTYYFKIIPLDAAGMELGSASDIVSATIGDLSPSGSNCIVKWIIVTDVTIGEKRYLTRSWVLNASKYVIYRSEFETADVTKMNKVAEVLENRFEYPFNKDAKQEKYAYYVVEAVCTDGSTIIVDNVKKVQTWPMESILLFIVITLLIYSSYRLYIYAQTE